VAALLPWSLPRISRSPYIGPLISVAYAGIVAAPLLPGGAGWVAFAAPPASVLVARRLRKPDDQAEPNTPSIRSAVPVVVPALAAVIVSLVALDPGGFWDAVREIVDSNSFVVAASGAVGAVFLGGPVVAWVLAPFSAALPKSPPGGNGEAARELKSLKSAGTLIGWFERALFFALLAAGSPEAAAVALTAKSVARFPLLSKHEEGFAEYFLIGTLSSLTIATATAIAVRGALGLSAL